MQIFIKLIIFIVILACAAPFFIKGPNGNALLQTKDIQLSFLDGATAQGKKIWQQLTQGSGVAYDSAEVYKWVDSRGVTHYSDKGDPKHGKSLSELQGISVLPTKAAKKNSQSNFPVGLSTIPLQKIPELINDTQQVKKIMEGRGQQLDNALKY